MNAHSPRPEDPCPEGPPAEAGAAPELSVVVPTYGRPETVRALLERLARQTLAPERFEVLVCDDGTPEPIRVAVSDYPFELTLLRQANAGPGPARNRAFERCRAPLVLILNDDAVPADDLLAGHLAAHAGTEDRVAFLGTFQFTEAALQSPFTQVLSRTDLLFDFPNLEHGQRYGWQHFWTCNISLPLEAVRSVGGFDPAFDSAIVEDVELGYRLAKEGWEVEYRTDLVAEHAHVQRPASYFERGRRLGLYLARMYNKHLDHEILWAAPGVDVENEHVRAMQGTIEAYAASVPKLIDKLERIERERAGQELSESACEQLATAVRRLSFVPFAEGALEELEGAAPQLDPPAEVRTSLVVVAMDALEQTRGCLEALRTCATGGIDQQLVFVDNGSTDGTAEYLEAQADVELIRNPRNLGAPRARNQAIQRCTGEIVVFLDNDVVVTPGWLERVCWHARVDRRSGAIGVLSDRAAHHLQHDCPPGEEAAHGLAAQRARDHHRQFRWQVLMPSFCLAVRREVLEALGGFDEWFSPWGFEDDDFTLRASLAGFRNRAALDVFVRHEAYRGRAKAERHAELLARNWKRFALRWGGSADAEYGTYDWLDQRLDAGELAGHPLYRDPRRQTSGDCVLLWPDYSDVQALATGLRDLLRPGDARDLSVALRIDPGLDGGTDSALRALESALETLQEPDSDLEVQLLDSPDPDEALSQARILCSSMSPAGASAERLAWIRSSGLEERAA